MAAQHRRNIVATLLQLAGLTRQAKALTLGPGCTCASCVQAWDRQRPAKTTKPRDTRRYRRLGLY